MFVRAIEGDTNATVLDSEFRRKADPPSQAKALNRTGIPAPPVGSINRPQMFTNPRAANPNAASDLKGQNRLSVPLERLAQNQAKIIGNEKKAQTKVEKQILSTAIAAIERNRERQGMGELTTPPDLASAVAMGAELSSQEQALWNSLPIQQRQALLAPYAAYLKQPTLEPVQAQMTSPLDPVAIAQKVSTGQALTAQEKAVWAAQSPLARGVWTVLPQVQSAATGASFLSQIQAWLYGETFPGVKNMYLVGAVGGVALIGLVSKRRR